MPESVLKNLEDLDVSTRSASSNPDLVEGKRSFYRGTLCQVLIVGVVTFLTTGLWGAMNNLGAGGALEPYLVNAANSILFAFMGLFCILSPLLVNTIGVKYTLVLGTAGWPVYSAALYQNNRYGTQWFVILGSVICGISAGMYWAAEGAIILSYPERPKRGRALGIWSVFKNIGQIVGCSINLGLNAKSSTGGKVSYNGLFAFVILQVLGFPIAFLVSRPEKVQREDRTKVVVEERTSTLGQLRVLLKTVVSRRHGCLLPLFFTSWFYWGFSSTFLTLYFSVRGRALGALISAICQATSSSLLGFYLDTQHHSIKKRARLAGGFVMALYSGVLIWAIVVQHAYLHKNPGKLDWLSPGFGRAFGLHVMFHTAGGLLQCYLYWAVGMLGDGTNELTRAAGLLRGVESWGRCASFGISSSHFNPLYNLVINIVFWTVSVPVAWLSLRDIGQGKAAVESRDLHETKLIANQSTVV